MRGCLCLRKKWSHSKGLLLYIFKIGKNESTFVFPMEMFPDGNQVEGGREGEGEKGRGRGEDPQVGCGPRKGKQARQRKTPLWAFDGRDFLSSTSGGGGIGWTCSQPSFQCVDLEMPVLTLTTALSPSTIQHQSYASQTEICAHLSTV